MRFLSLMLLICIVLLSSFGTMAKPVQPKMMDCCKEMEKMACHKKSAEKQSKDDGCDQPGCAMMFSCSDCGFVLSQSFILQPLLAARTLPKPVAHYISGNLPAYHADSWKPPRTC